LATRQYVSVRHGRRPSASHTAHSGWEKGQRTTITERSSSVAGRGDAAERSCHSLEPASASPPV